MRWVKSSHEVSLDMLFRLHIRFPSPVFVAPAVLSESPVRRMSPTGTRSRWAQRGWKAIGKVGKLGACKASGLKWSLLVAVRNPSS